MIYTHILGHLILDWKFVRFAQLCPNNHFVHAKRTFLAKRTKRLGVRFIIICNEMSVLLPYARECPFCGLCPGPVRFAPFVRFIVIYRIPSARQAKCPFCREPPKMSEMSRMSDLSRSTCTYAHGSDSCHSDI